MIQKRKATIEDLYHVPEDGKAELVNGEIVRMPPTGDMPSSGGQPYPSRAAIGVASLPRGALVEINCILYAG